MKIIVMEPCNGIPIFKTGELKEKERRKGELNSDAWNLRKIYVEG